MTNKLKSNLDYVFCAGLGFLNFILFAFSYAASYWEYDLGSWGGVQSSSLGISGYQLMKLWEGGFGGVMSSFIQLIIFLAGLGMLAWGVCGLLKAFDILPQFPGRIGKFDNGKITEYALFGMAGLQVLLLVFLIIFTASNSESAYGTSAGIRLSAGVFVTLVVYGGAVAARIWLKKKLPEGELPETVSYVCSNCGKRAKASSKFCSVCGSAVVQA